LKLMVGIAVFNLSAVVFSILLMLCMDVARH
jgi:hypothetical protein